MVTTPPDLRGFFGLGVEQISKSANLGNLVRSAYSFGAGFFFTINAQVNMRELRASDTADAANHLPFYSHDTIAELTLPKGCQLVGVELTDDAVELPSFRHPLKAAYILGPERGSLSPEVQAACDYIVKIPMRYCVNVGVAGALVMYDRMISLGKFAERPVRTGGPTQAKPVSHGHALPKFKQKKA